MQITNAFKGTKTIGKPSAAFSKLSSAFKRVDEAKAKTLKLMALGIPYISRLFKSINMGEIVYPYDVVPEIGTLQIVGDSGTGKTHMVWASAIRGALQNIEEEKKTKSFIITTEETAESYRDYVKLFIPYYLELFGYPKDNITDKLINAVAQYIYITDYTILRKYLGNVDHMSVKNAVTSICRENQDLDEMRLFIDSMAGFAQRASIGKANPEVQMRVFSGSVATAIIDARSEMGGTLLYMFTNQTSGGSIQHTAGGEKSDFIADGIIRLGRLEALPDKYMTEKKALSMLTRVGGTSFIGYLQKWRHAEQVFGVFSYDWVLGFPVIGALYEEYRTPTCPICGDIVDLSGRYVIYMKARGQEYYHPECFKGEERKKETVIESNILDIPKKEVPNIENIDALTNDMVKEETITEEGIKEEITEPVTIEDLISISEEPEEQSTEQTINSNKVTDNSKETDTTFDDLIKGL